MLGTVAGGWWYCGRSVTKRSGRQHRLVRPRPPTWRGASIPNPRGEQRIPPRHFWRIVFARLSLACVLLTAAPAWAQTAPGTTISNTAYTDYSTSTGQPRSVASNAVDIATVAARTDAVAEFIRVAPAGGTPSTVPAVVCLTGGTGVTLPLPNGPDGTPIASGQAIALDGTAFYGAGETAFLRVDDRDQNVDSAALDTIEVTVTADGDAELLQLTETAIASGIFVGYVGLTSAGGVSGDCALSAPPEANLELRYVDAADSNDEAMALASINPINRVFDATTGAVVDGVTITLVDAVTGLPAVVYGNDGVSAFPATVRSGEPAADASGLVYAVPDGGFLFPVVAPGDYRLVIEPPSGFLAPSVVAPNELSALPNAPFAISDGSFARVFTLAANDALRIDVPVDPVSGGLFLTKTASAQVAAPGDFVQYRLDLENTSEQSAAIGVAVVDTLPPGFVLVADSVRVDGTKLAAERTAGGFELALGTLPASARLSITYVVEVTGGARGDEAVNEASAISDRGLASNKATAAIRLRDDLLRERSTIIGRIVEGDCAAPTFDETEGVAGIRIYLEDGRYAVSDAAGRFHFEGVRPGLHNVQLDDATVPDYLELSACDVDTRRAGSVRSTFIDARGGALHRADFYLRRKPAPVGRVDIEMSNTPGVDAEHIRYRVTLTGVGEFPAQNLTVTSILPSGLRYVRNSATLTSAAKVTATPQGPAIIFRLGDRDGKWADTLEFMARASAAAEGTLETRTVASFDTPSKRGMRTPAVTTVMERTRAVSEAADYVLSLKFGVLSAELAASDRAELDVLIDAWRGVEQIEISALGHSDNVPIAARNRDRFADNYALSEARARTVARYLADALKVATTEVSTSGRGPDAPVATNDTADGRAQNRRVELIMRGKRPAQQAALATRVESSGQETVRTTGALPGPADLSGRTVQGPASVDEILNAQKLPLPAADALSPGLAWVLPIENARPAIPSMRVAVQHEPGQKVRLAVNGADVPALSLEGVEVGRLSKVALTSWRAVRLDAGRNTLSATVLDADGSVANVLTRDVHFAGGPLRAEFVPEASYLIADGKQRPVLAVRLYDGDGELARTGAVGRFQVDAPYRSWWEVQTSQENNLVAAGEREPLYRVEPDGIARIELEPTTESGELTLRLAFENQREQEIRTWLEPAPRDWILVAIAHGTAAYNTLRDNMQAAEAAGFDDDYVEDGRVAFFAKGRVRGDALLTVAYDTRGEAEDFRRFDDVIDPNAFYTLYGDGTESRFEAASQRKLYLKLERRQFALLFGDYQTGLGITELARYERRFNGAKLGFSGKHLQLTAFAADSAQQFQRDELRGNGTSGLYSLSTGGLLPNSEVVSIEVRDRFDASEVLSTTTLTRFVDYSIDNARGTLLFRRPIASRDDAFNPQFIVVQYETAGNTGDDVTAGGRVAIRNSDATIEVGASLIREAQLNGDGELLAADIAWQPSATTRITAEYADTIGNDGAAERRGHGYRVEVEHRTGRADIEAFHARVEPEFGLGQQNVSEIGLEKTGVNGRVRLRDGVHTDAELVRQENLDTGLIRDLANVSVNASMGQFSADVGVTHARDETTAGETRESTLATFALGQRVLDERIMLRLAAEVPLADDDDVADYPSRMLAGLDWTLGRTATAFIEHEIADGGSLESDMTRVGLRAQPWQRARFDTALTQELTEFGPRLFATIGAVQGWQISERWSLDVGVDQSNTMLSPDAIVFDDERELVSGSQSEDFFAAHLGSAYNAGPWTLNARAEHRNADRSESLNLIAGLYRETARGHGVSAALEWFDRDLIDGATSTTATLRAGWAYRLPNQRWVFLNRSDLVVEEQSDASSAIDNWRLVNNFAANWRLSAASEFNFTLGAKYVRGDFDGFSASGFTTLTGAEWRRAVSQRWDFGVHGDVYRSWRAEVSDYSAGLDVGYVLAENMRVTLGYNLTGFRDEDFSAGNYTAEGPYLRFALKADQETLKQLAGIRRR